MKVLEKDLEKVCRDIETTECVIGDITSEIDVYLKKRTVLQQELYREEKIFHRLDTRLTELENTISEKESHILVLEQDISELTMRTKSVDSQVQHITEEQEKLESTLRSQKELLDKECCDLGEDTIEREKRISSLEEGVQKLHQQSDALLKKQAQLDIDMKSADKVRKLAAQVSVRCTSFEGEIVNVRVSSKNDPIQIFTRFYDPISSCLHLNNAEFTTSPYRHSRSYC